MSKGEKREGKNGSVSEAGSTAPNIVRPRFSALRRVEANRVEARQSAIGTLRSETTRLEMSPVGFARSTKTEVEKSPVGVLVANEVAAEDIRAGIIIAGRVRGNSRAIIDKNAILAVGAVACAAIGVFSWFLFGRRSRS